MLMVRSLVLALRGTRLWLSARFDSETNRVILMVLEHLSVQALR
jgi:hypothetical protein